MDFMHIWALLEPQGEYKRRENACRRLWQGYSPKWQQSIYDTISKAKANGEAVNVNPYFAIEDVAISLKTKQPRRQTMSFDDYYKHYGTTEDRDGWHRTFLPDQHKTIYVKE